MWLFGASLGLILGCLGAVGKLGGWGGAERPSVSYDGGGWKRWQSGVDAGRR